LYVLGVGEDVRMLDKISDAEKAAELIRSFESERTMTGNTWMSRVFGRPRAAEPEQPPMDESVSFNELIERHMGKAADQRQMIKQLLQKENYTDRSMDK
jgi:flagellar protein FliO/FliZ